ncbi:MAG: restriction endonuclease [Methanobacteriaceae archaeon]|nr:restriction endonuclease [Methanobacteriaceae archaeon]
MENKSNDLDNIISDHLDSITENEVIEVQEMDLDEWLELVFSKKDEEYLFIDYMFPNESLRKEYLENIQIRKDEEVINLIRKFLIPSGSFNGDIINLGYLVHCNKNDKPQFKKLIGREYYKRLLKSALKKESTVWEGNTWIIDLLPHNPKLAIDAIEAYFIAHIQLLPDGRFSGLQDAKAIIRSKFIYAKHPESILLSLNPYDFEKLISALYKEMGYETIITKKSGDGGVDVKAEKDSIGEKEKLLIQCKRYEGTVGQPYIRDLYGAVNDAKANKGVLVTTSYFSKPGIEFATKNNIELINGNQLQIILNKHFGTKWPYHLDHIISRSN